MGLLRFLADRRPKKKQPPKPAVRQQRRYVRSEALYTHRAVCADENALGMPRERVGVLPAPQPGTSCTCTPGRCP